MDSAGLARPANALMSGVGCAVAIFARTPGRSPPKTRLAAQIGPTQASRLYVLALDCAARLGRKLVAQGCEVCWAVAEKGAHTDSFWGRTGLPAVCSGDGDLGNRFDHVYRLLLAKAEVAVLIGSDTPQLGADRIVCCAAKARGGFAVGPAADGGFYIFAGSKPVGREVWTVVKYSRADTLARLLHVLGGKVSKISEETDFDDVDSLRRLLAGSRALRNAQWLRFAQAAKQCLAAAAPVRKPCRK